MARAAKRTNKNNIVILCEGSDTEVKYFEDIKKFIEKNASDRFTDIRIVPVPTDIEIKKKRESGKRKSRKLNPVEGYFYWVKQENSKEEYDLYKAQPTRYVRETQLFMEEDGYVEGWAVFDQDTFTEHQYAFEMAESIDGLNIAFSSRCFEEWLLLHFERNDKAFTVSVCKNENDKDKGCGTGIDDDCHGTICLGGYIREKGYIPDYAKNKENLFEKYTSARMELCCLNAAWSRTLSSKPPYHCNPYTSVDALVKHLLGIEVEYKWHNPEEEFPFSGGRLCVSSESGQLHIKNCGKRAVLLNENTCIICGEDAKHIRGWDLGYLSPQDSKSENFYTNESFLCLKEHTGSLCFIKLS